MPTFFKQSTQENRIKNAGRWPIRLTHFHLTDEYSFPATNFPEIFYVQEGGLLHVTKNGKQTIREGFAILVHPGHQHKICNPENVVLTRIRFLPEWFAMEFYGIIDMPDVLTLFFDQSWLQYPREDALHVFNTQESTRDVVTKELTYLEQVLQTGDHLNPTTRLSLLKLMEGLARDFQRYWRGAGNPAMSLPVRYAFDVMERRVFAGLDFEEGIFNSSVYEQDEVESSFRAYTGLSPHEYYLRRRIFHGAYTLVSSDETPKQVARICGYSDLEAFGTAFEDIFEITPDVYREKFKTLTGSDETVG